MISCKFLCGGKWRHVKVEDRKITFMTEELGYEPLVINLDELDGKQEKIKLIKLSEKDIELMKELRDLGSEEEIMRDIELDFRKTGWRVFKKNDTN